MKMLVWFKKRIISQAQILLIIRRSLKILEENDRKKTFIVLGIYGLLGTLDLVAAFTFGVVGSLTVNQLASNQPGERVSLILELLRISDIGIRLQIAILGVIASTILIVKSMASLYLSRKALFFLSRRAAFISKVLVKQVLSGDILSVRNKSLQETIFAVTSGVQVVTAGILGASLVLFSDIFLIVVFSVSLFFVDAIVALLSLFLFAFVGIFLYLTMHRRARLLGQYATERGIESNSKISEAVLCYRELLVKDRRIFYANKIGDLQLGVAESTASMSFMGYISKYVLEVTVVLGALIVGFTQFLLQPPPRAIAILSIYLVASARLAPATLRVQSGLLQLKSSLGTAEPTLNLIEAYSNAADSRIMKQDYIRHSKRRSDFVAEVRVKDLDFSFAKKKRVLSGVSFRLEAGEFTAITGPSGVGKTTLVDLMLGVLHPDKGQILISGNRPVECFKKWPGAVAYVPQETTLINGSIKANVCLGYEEDSVQDSLVEELLSCIQLQELLDLPAGIRTFLGEGGRTLSGGQRQRLGIARALLTEPKILILDESTSGLDAQTESRVMAYLETFRGRVTTVIISHRDSVVKKCDKILRLENGQISISNYGFGQKT